MSLRRLVGIITGFLVIAIGIFCTLNPSMTYQNLGLSVGLSMFIDGIGQLIIWWQIRDTEDSKYMLFGGILSLIFAVLIITNNNAQATVNMMIAYLAAIWILIRGVLAIYISLKIKKIHKKYETQYLGTKWWHRFGFGILMCILSIICLIHPGIMINYIGVLIGLGIISLGADMITTANVL